MGLHAGYKNSCCKEKLNSTSKAPSNQKFNVEIFVLSDNEKCLTYGIDCRCIFMYMTYRILNYEFDVTRGACG